MTIRSGRRLQNLSSISSLTEHSLLVLVFPYNSCVLYQLQLPTVLLVNICFAAPNPSKVTSAIYLCH